MIFVTVGTEKYPFDRLIRAADELSEVTGGEEIFMQIGTGAYIPASAHARFVSHQEFCDKIEMARVVVSHAGSGTMLMCANIGKVPIMMARQRCFGEHVDDHQRMLATRMSELGRILLVSGTDDLRDHIVRYDELCQALARTKSAEPTLTKHLKSLLQEIAQA